jgi:DNA primase
VSAEEVLRVVAPYLSKYRRTSNAELNAVCPFHRKADGREEKGPSFYLNLMTGLWWCHSCHLGGGLRKFLREAGAPTTEFTRNAYLLEEVAKNAPPRPDPARPRSPSSDAPLEEQFLGLFDTIPQQLLEPEIDDDGRIDAPYSAEVIRHLDIGLDRVHQRITFPLRDMDCRLIGISGRAIEKGVKPRYKVYDKEYLRWGLPERKLEKSAMLWNYQNVLPQVLFTEPKDRYVVLVEGFKACMRLVDSGIRSTVALLGSYLAPEQLWLLERLGATVFVMLDNDEAGYNAILPTCLLLSKSLPVRLVGYEADQPNYLTAEEIHTALDNAPFFLPWYISQKLQQN